MQEYKQALELDILQVIKSKYGLDIKNFDLKQPPKSDLGDFAFNCGVLSRDLRKSPNDIALELIDEIKKIQNIDSLNIDGGYINIKISNIIYLNLYNYIYTNIENIIGISKNNNKNIIIDYIGANVGKPLHIGHMCTPNQGQAIINIYKKLGYNVISDSHIGDWGIIFGKLILSYKLYGDETKLKENAVVHLFELYVKISSEIEEQGDILEQKTRDEFKLLSQGNTESIELWKKFTRYSIDAINIQLERLNIKPDYNIGESFYEGLGLPKMENYPDLHYSMYTIVEELVKKSIAVKNDDNSVGVIFGDETKIPSCILQKKDGTHGYLASDLACIKYRMENWNPEKIIYFIDSRQQLHLKQVFEISKKAGWVTETTQLFHAYNGFISLKDGAMSTRKGRIIKLDALLDEAELRAKNIILSKRDDIVGLELDKIAKIVGIGAIKYGYLKKSRELDVIFDWDEFLSFDGNSGPYIQYAYVRALRILEKFKNEFNLDFAKLEYDKNINLDFFEEKELIKTLSTYNNILELTVKNNYPHILCKFCYDLTKSFNTFYNNVNILGEENESKKLFGIGLVFIFSKILKDAFGLLGIEMPDKM